MSRHAAGLALLRIALAFALAATASAPSQERYWDRRGEGWFWYRDPPRRAETAPEGPPAAEKLPAPGKTSPPTELERHAALRRNLGELRAIAVMNPTRENMGRYMRLQQHALQLSATFADQWRRLVWAVPELDYSLQFRPTNAVAAAIHDERQRAERGARLQELAKTRGLALFFAAECPLCREMGRTLARLAAKHGLHVMGISADGSDLAELNDVRQDNGIGAALGVGNYPSVYLFDPGALSAEPVGAGLMSLEELETRIDTLAHFKPGTQF